MLDPEYILGLVDGEGSFTVYIRNPDGKKKIKRRVRAEPRFYLRLQETDKEILYRLKKSFGCGNVYFQKDSRKNHKDCYRYEVGNRRDIEKIIIPFFKKHRPRLVSRRKDFKIFSEIMREISKGRHLTKVGLRSLYKLKQKMH